MLSNLFILAAALAGLMFALLLGLFLVAAFNVLIIEPGARWRARRRARKAKSRQTRYYAPTPRLRRRSK
jgi:O-antigen ligase